MDDVIIISADFFYNRAKKCSYYKDFVLNPLSAKVQRYNAEALGIESKEPVEVVVADMQEEPIDLKGYLMISGKKYLKECCKKLKDKKTALVQLYKKKGEK